MRQRLRSRRRDHLHLRQWIRLWRPPPIWQELGRPAVRTATRKYVRHDDGFEELYDLVADPYELDNKVKDPRYASDTAMLRDLHGRLKSCVSDGCWVP